MDVNSLRQMYQQNAVKIEIPALHHVFSVMLHHNFLLNKLTDLPVRHCHTRFEVLCFESAALQCGSVFRIIPPNVWHESNDCVGRESQFLTTFQFSVKDSAAETRSELCNSALEAFLKIDAPVEIPDTFDGARLLRQIRLEISNGNNVNYGLLNAQFQLLLIELACALPKFKSERRVSWKYSVDDFRPEIIESFMVYSHHDPDCSREQLAKILCISERQTVRIIERLFHKSFRELLTEYRMEFAESWRVHKGLNAAQTAAKVGYRSKRNFLEAYKSYYGFEYVDEM